MLCTALETRCDAEKDIQMQEGAAPDDWPPIPSSVVTQPQRQKRAGAAFQSG